MDINTYKNIMNQTEPCPELINKTKSIMRASLAITAAAETPKKRRAPLHTIAIAAIIAVLTVTTAVATGLPGYIRSLTAGDLTVNEYEEGMLPYVDMNDPANKDRFGVLSIGGVIVDDYIYTELDSMQEAQEVLGKPLLVPAYLENGEVPVFVRKFTHSAGTSVEVCYANGYRTSSGMFVSNGPGFFILAFTDVGGEQTTFDVMGETYKTAVNEHEAIWIGQKNGGLYWIQDGLFVQLLPCDLETEYVMKIAESLTYVSELPAMGTPESLYYPPFYTMDGEYVDPMAEYEYAVKIFEESDGATRPYYTRDQLAQYYSEVMAEAEATGVPYETMLADVRQPHIQPEPLYERDSGGGTAPSDLCNNTVYFSIDGQRVCSSCGYIFTEGQNSEIGWK